MSNLEQLQKFIDDNTDDGSVESYCDYRDWENLDLQEVFGKSQYIIEGSFGRRVFDTWAEREEFRKTKALKNTDAVKLNTVRRFNSYDSLWEWLWNSYDTGREEEAEVHKELASAWEEQVRREITEEEAEYLRENIHLDLNQHFDKILNTELTVGIALNLTKDNQKKLFESMTPVGKAVFKKLTREIIADMTIEDEQEKPPLHVTMLLTVQQMTLKDFFDLTEKKQITLGKDWDFVLEETQYDISGICEKPAPVFISDVAVDKSLLKIKPSWEFNTSYEAGSDVSETYDWGF